MAQLAIKGHSTRGKDVIKTLEMLGGHNNSHNFLGGTEYNYYYIGNYNTISCIPRERIDSSFVIFTLEEFLQEFPYKVGDKVVVKGLSEYPKSIHFMKWFDNNIHYSFDNETWFLPSALNPYKEETMEKEISGAIVNRFICLEGYDFYDDKGNVIDTKEITMKKKQPKYPKTYEECHELTVQWKEYDCNPNSELVLSEIPVHDFCKLIVARNIYWKIAGEQMGLGKPWEPDWTNEKQIIYGLYNELKYSIINPSQFVFPTEEMRDAFYENFKETIEECKELL